MFFGLVILRIEGSALLILRNENKFHPLSRKVFERNFVTFYLPRAIIDFPLDASL